MKKIKLSKIEHRNEQRIKVQFEKQTDLINKIKTIDGRRWSKTKNCWHLPYSKESFEALKTVFGKSNLDYPKEKADKNPSVIIKPKFIDYQLDGKTYLKVVGEKILLIKRNKNWVEAYVPFDKKNWIEAIQNIEGRKWDSEKTAWYLPNVKATFRHLKKFVELKNIVFQFEIEKDIPDSIPTKSKVKKPIKSTSSTLSNYQKEAIIKLEEQIILKRYSPATLKSYRGHLIAILLFFPKLLPEQIGSKEIQKYLLHQIKSKKIAEATQNQIINAYKFYVEQVLKRPKAFIEIPRPKKPRQLPNVLSQEEVVALLKAPKNLKHKLILMLIYSCGLRLSEVVNIRIRDVNEERNNIFIRAGKGKKDRFATLADSLIPYLKTYKKQFNPVYWLLEGANGGQYSKSSVQKVLRKAVEDSKVNPYATVHTLRHSYATHCVENGFSLALIQKALGHNSLKTTERYLHISNKAMKHLKSPLDIIEQKNKNKL